MRVGITGHQRLVDPQSWDWVHQEIRKTLASLTPPVVGVSSLAIGADTTFAQIVLELGGSLSIVLPFIEYEQTFSSTESKQEYQRLLRAAATIEVLSGRETNEESFYAAGKRVVDLSELLIVVWDGKAARGLGGTADIAAYAREHRKRSIWLNPEARITSDLNVIGEL